MGSFAVVQVGETSLDFIVTVGDVASRHFAFLVSEAEFDDIFGRIRKQGICYWAGPTASGSQNHADPFQILEQSARLSVLAVITEPRVIAAILAHLENRAPRAPPPVRH